MLEVWNAKQDVDPLDCSNWTLFGLPVLKVHDAVKSQHASGKSHNRLKQQIDCSRPKEFVLLVRDLSGLTPQAQNKRSQLFSTRSAVFKRHLCFDHSRGRSNLHEFKAETDVGSLHRDLLILAVLEWWAPFRTIEGKTDLPSVFTTQDSTIS